MLDSIKGIKLLLDQSRLMQQLCLLTSCSSSVILLHQALQTSMHRRMSGRPTIQSDQNHRHLSHKEGQGGGANTREVLVKL